MVKLLILLVFLLLSYWIKQQGPLDHESGGAGGAWDQSVPATRLPANAGTVVRVLPDDTSGSRHQKFILRLNDGRTVMIAHNIDIAPRVVGLRIGGVVEFQGKFVSSPEGGVVHWTHHDPSGRQPEGWLKYNGRTYR